MERSRRDLRPSSAGIRRSGLTGTEQPHPVPVGDASQTGGTWPPTLAAFGVAAFAALIAFETPVAVVTSFEGSRYPTRLWNRPPQWPVAVGLAIAAAIVGGTVGGMLVRRWATRPGGL